MRQRPAPSSPERSRVSKPAYSNKSTAGRNPATCIRFTKRLSCLSAVRYHALPHLDCDAFELPYIIRIGHSSHIQLSAEREGVLLYQCRHQGREDCILLCRKFSVGRWWMVVSRSGLRNSMRYPVTVSATKSNTLHRGLYTSPKNAY